MEVMTRITDEDLNGPSLLLIGSRLACYTIALACQAPTHHHTLEHSDHYVSDPGEVIVSDGIWPIFVTSTWIMRKRGLAEARVIPTRSLTRSQL